MPALHIFNPGSETAVLAETHNYTPTANVAKMAKDLSLLPLWYADPADLVLSAQPAEDKFTSSLPEELGRFARALKPHDKSDEAYSAVPWGLSPQILHTFKKIKENNLCNLSVPAWDTHYKTLTGRQSTIRCHQLLQEHLPGTTLPEAPLVFSSLDAIEERLKKSTPPFVLKTPYSSSGRGINWLRSRELANAEKNLIKGAIKKQGFVSLEKGLDKVMDFALEFHSDGKGKISYEGISVFSTEEKGAYNGNRLASQASLSHAIETLANAPVLDTIGAAVAAVLKTVYGNAYAGYLGVDMMLYKTGDRIAVHPCVEVNMRFTMGLVALRLFERHIHPSAEGNYFVTFDKEPGAALEKHLASQKKHPLTYNDKRISKGYLSLCPVTEKTNYRAFIIV